MRSEDHRPQYPVITRRQHDISELRRRALTYTSGQSGLSSAELRERRQDATQDPELAGSLRAAVLTRYDELIATAAAREERQR